MGERGAAEDVLSRGGRKLEAALERFDLGAAVKGAAAVDVGASTGGFTAALLRHGARSVVAVDVGHGQLHAALRADARVTAMENSDWKTLALTEAPGPFDFFTVDVSFVAARNMLRGLALRLRPGAEGVVLVKPQFELADKQVRGGRGGDENLRRAGLGQGTKTAAELGLAGVAHSGSPVEGGRGRRRLRGGARGLGRGGGVEARGCGRPRRGRARLRGAPCAPGGATVAVRASATKCRVYHAGGSAESVLLGVGDAVGDVRP